MELLVMQSLCYLIASPLSGPNRPLRIIIIVITLSLFLCEDQVSH